MVEHLRGEVAEAVVTSQPRRPRTDASPHAPKPRSRAPRPDRAKLRGGDGKGGHALKAGHEMERHEARRQ